MTANDFTSQILFCQEFNSNTEQFAYHQIHTYLSDYYNKLIHFKRDLMIAAYSKSKTQRYEDLTADLFIKCINALNTLQYKGCFSLENEKITAYLIDNCISAINNINTSLVRIRKNATEIDFYANEDHKSKVLSLKENAKNSKTI